MEPTDYTPTGELFYDKAQAEEALRQAEAAFVENNPEPCDFDVAYYVVEQVEQARRAAGKPDDAPITWEDVWAVDADHRPYKLAEVTTDPIAVTEDEDAFDG